MESNSDMWKVDGCLLWLVEGEEGVSLNLKEVKKGNMGDRKSKFTNLKISRFKNPEIYKAISGSLKEALNKEGEKIEV